MTRDRKTPPKVVPWPAPDFRELNDLGLSQCRRAYVQPLELDGRVDYASSVDERSQAWAHAAMPLGCWRRSYADDMTGTISGLDVEEFARWWQETGEYELRQILYWKWDPIGVVDMFPDAADEYDSYAPQVVAALSGGASAVELAELFGNIEHERMGLGERPPRGAHADRLRDLGADIVAWFAASQIRWAEFGPLRR